MKAIDYSPFIDLINLNDLTTLGITMSTVPRTLTLFTMLSMYTNNPTPSQYTPPTSPSDSAGPTRTSVGAALIPTLRGDLLVGGDRRGYDPGLMGLTCG